MFFLNKTREEEDFKISNNQIILCTNFNNCSNFIIKDTRKKGENKDFCDICMLYLEPIKPKDKKILNQRKLI